MNNRAIMITFLFLLIAGVSCSQNKDELLLDDFEGAISAGPEGTIDAGSGAGSAIEVKGSAEIKYHGNQSLEIKFDAVPGGYMWAGRGYGLDVKGAAAWLVEPKDIDFGKFNAIAFYLYGGNTNAQIAIDIIDSGREYWRYLITDNFSGWKEFTISFSDFFPRGDWQPEAADKNAELNLPINAFQLEPRPIGKGTIYFDYVRLVSIKK